MLVIHVNSNQFTENVGNVEKERSIEAVGTFYLFIYLLILFYSFFITDVQTEVQRSEVMYQKLAELFHICVLSFTTVLFLFCILLLFIHRHPCENTTAFFVFFNF